MLIDWCHVGVFFVIIPVRKFLIILQVFFRHFYHFISLFVSFLSSLLICFSFALLLFLFIRDENSPIPNKRKLIYIFVIQIILLFISKTVDSNTTAKKMLRRIYGVY